MPDDAKQLKHAQGYDNAMRAASATQKVEAWDTAGSLDVGTTLRALKAEVDLDMEITSAPRGP